MKTKFALIYAVICSFCHAQPVYSFHTSFDITKGNVSNIKNIKRCNAIFIYDSLEIKNFISEEEFLAKEIEKTSRSRNKEIDFSKKWNELKEYFFPEKFILLFNNYGAKKLGLSTSLIETSNDYNLIVSTIRIDPDFRKDDYSLIDLKLTFTDKNGLILLQIIVRNMPGEGNKLEERISESYAKAAKDLIKFLEKLILF